MLFDLKADLRGLIGERPMSLKYVVSEDGKFVYTTVSGTLEEEEIIKYLHDVIKDKRIKPGFSELFDMTHLSGSPITPDLFLLLRDLIASNPKKNPQSKVAIVAGPAGSFEKARQFESVVSPEVANVIVFGDIETARVWLGVKDSKI
jgi:hypothetical protein